MCAREFAAFRQCVLEQVRSSLAPCVTLARESGKRRLARANRLTLT